jgi:hypothetical protein
MDVQLMDGFSVAEAGDRTDVPAAAPAYCEFWTYRSMVV